MKGTTSRTRAPQAAGRLLDIAVWGGGVTRSAEGTSVVAASRSGRIGALVEEAGSAGTGGLDLGGGRLACLAGSRRAEWHRRQGLAMPLSSLVGRTAETGAVVGSLLAASLVTLTGPGGVGKSRLAQEVAATFSQGGEQVAVVDVTASSERRAVLPAVAAALRVVRTPDRSLFEAVVRHLGEDSLLLVLDGCERLRDRCAHVAAGLLGACAGLRILVTSRERLGAPGEAVWPVPSLSLPAGTSPQLPEAFTGSDAVQLFCERAAALRRGFLPTPGTIEAIVAICRRLDGNPLAIELAAARVVALSPGEIAARLDDRFALLRGGSTTAPARQRSLRASMDWSYELLAPAERALLSRLSVFPASFGLAAVEEVGAGGEVELGQVLPLLTSLVDKSVVVSESSSSAARFRLPGTVCAYAAERLEQAGSTEPLAERHAAWCLRLVEGSPAERRRAHRPDWMPRVEAEAASLDAAVAWALGHGHGELALRLVDGQTPLWWRRGRFAEALDQLERVLGGADPAPAAALAKARHDAGVAAMALGRWEAATGHLQAGLALFADGGGSWPSIRTRAQLALARTLVDCASSAEELEQAAADARSTGDDACVAEVLEACGQACLLRGEPAEARAHYEASRQAAGRAGYDWRLAAILLGLGSVALVQGDLPAAEAHLEESMAASVAWGDEHIEVLAACGLANLALVRGDHGESSARFAATLTRARAMAAPVPLARCLTGLGRALLEGGDPVASRPRFDEALAVARAANLGHLVVPALTGRARALLALGDVAGAGDDLEEALALARRRADTGGEALALEGYAQVSLLEGDAAEAASRCRRALALQAEVGDPAGTARGLEALGILAANGDDRRVAARLLAAADGLRARIGCGPVADVGQDAATAIDLVRVELGETSFAAEWHTGGAWSTEAAIACALRLRTHRVPQPSAAWDLLTPTERHVAARAASGLANAAIAGELVVSCRTVETHLQRTYAKLGIRSRKKLIAYVGGDGVART